MEIKDRDELRKYLTENYYITILRRGGTNRHVHKGNCPSLRGRGHWSAKLGQTKTQKHYFVFDTMNEACNKYFERVGRKIAENNPNYIPYCKRCLTSQHDQWRDTHHKSKDD